MCRVKASPTRHCAAQLIHELDLQLGVALAVSYTCTPPPQEFHPSRRAADLDDSSVILLCIRFLHSFTSCHDEFCPLGRPCQRISLLPRRACLTSRQAILARRLTRQPLRERPRTTADRPAHHQNSSSCDTRERTVIPTHPAHATEARPRRPRNSIRSPRPSHCRAGSTTT
jgi:hypothetical protein